MMPHETLALLICIVKENHGSHSAKLFCTGFRLKCLNKSVKVHFVILQETTRRRGLVHEEKTQVRLVLFFFFFLFAILDPFSYDLSEVRAG